MSAGAPLGTLVSVNVGMPKDVPWQGKTVFTGVFKDPVTGPRRVRKLNVDGDGQGDPVGHGGEQRAVFVYQLDSYRYWERELGRSDFVHGQFGENFTIEGPGDDDVCIGDRYQIGSGVFEVTQPRVTCYRVGIRMNDPRIPALLVSHRRPGFYFRVLQEGEVEAGDEIIKLASGPEQMTARWQAAVDPSELLPLGTARCRLLPDHRQARTRRRRQWLSAYPPPRRRRTRDRSTSRHLHPRHNQGAGNADQRRHRRHSRARHAPHTRLRTHPTGGLVGPWRAQQSRPPFAAEVRALLASLPNVHTHVCYSRPGPDDLEGRDFESAGRLTAALLAELAPPRDAEAYLCGPAPFMEEISAGLASMGIDASCIHTEPFGPAPGLTPGIAATPARKPHPPSGGPGSGPTVEFARSDLAIPWSDDYASLLEFAEACDVPVRWSCRTGVCHNCETTLIGGSLDYNPDPVEPPAEGSALICCSRPHDDVVLDL